MFIKPEPFDENKTAKTYYDDMFLFEHLSSFFIILGWLFSMIYVFEYYQTNVFKDFWQEIWYCLTIIFSITFKFIIFAFFWFGAASILYEKFTTIKYIILAVVILMGVIGLRMYEYHNKTNNILCYTVNYEKYHLYEDCYFLESSENIESVECENIHDINICSLCQWHLETSQKIQKYEY